MLFTFRRRPATGPVESSRGRDEVVTRRHPQGQVVAVRPGTPGLTPERRRPGRSDALLVALLARAERRELRRPERERS